MISENYFKSKGDLVLKDIFKLYIYTKHFWLQKEKILFNNDFKIVELPQQKSIEKPSVLGYHKIILKTTYPSNDIQNFMTHSIIQYI